MPERGTTETSYVAGAEHAGDGRVTWVVAKELRNEPNPQSPGRSSPASFIIGKKIRKRSIQNCHMTSTSDATPVSKFTAITKKCGSKSGKPVSKCTIHCSWG